MKHFICLCIGMLMYWNANAQYNIKGYNVAINDSYYDFGTAGVVLFALVLGGGAFLLTRWTKKSENPLVYLFYGQIAIYLGLSFFTTWFSNPTTWFWLALTMMMYVGISWRKKTDGKS